MKKRILFISDVADFKGGAEKSLLDLMNNPNIEPFLVVPCKGEISIFAQNLNIKTYIIDFGNVLTIRRPFRIRDVVRTFFSTFKVARNINKISTANNISYLHSNGLKAHGAACFARIIGGRPVVAHFRAIPFTFPEKIFWFFVRIISTKMILVSRPCWFGKNLPRNAKVIFNGIKITSEPPFRTPQKPFVIGFAGRIQFTKGLDCLIEWFDYVYKSGINVRLIIRGEAAPDEPEYAEKIKQMVIEKGLQQVCVFEGKISGIDNIYAGIDVNVVPSTVPDPLPRSVMEASSLGIPVIGYPAGGIIYMFEDKESGFLCKDKEEFMLIIQNLINDSKLYRLISNAAFNNARRNFALESLHKKVNDEYL